MAKRIEDLVFTDDYMFGAVMRDEEICKKDWLGTGLPVATFQNICIQNKNIYLQDDCVKIFVNSELWEKESDIETRAFMNYLYTSEATDKLTSEINRKVDLTKLNEIFRNDYLSMNIHDYDLTYKAKKEGIIETAKAAIQEGISLETVAKICNLPLEQVQELSVQINTEKQD